MQLAQDQSSSSTVLVDPAGNILLQVSDQAYPSLTAAFRVSTERLRSASPYFRTLLEPTKFAEGINLEAELKLLTAKYEDAKDIPEDELPRIKLENIGRIGKIKEFRGLVTDFLLILHDKRLLKAPQSAIPLANLANLSIVADRFDALEALKSYAKKHKMFTENQRRKSAAVIENWNEERCRMRLLVAVLLNHGPWFVETLPMILKGSSQWRDTKVDSQALWWDLPHGMEEELFFRRSAVIKTLSLYLTRCLSLYTAGGLQCKLGYANSMQCDTFQLGQIIKFYNKLGLLHLESTMAGMEETNAFDGDIQKALDVLRQCPDYQVDKFHAHCGLRDRLIRLIEIIQSSLPNVAVCGDCWEADKARVFWKNSKPLAIAFLSLLSKGSGCHNGHTHVRDLYVANDKDWNDLN